MSTATDAGLVALAPNDWRGQWVNRQQLLSRLGVRWPIVYSTGAWLPWDRASDEWKRAPWTGEFVRENDVWVDTPPRALLRWPRMRGWDDAAVALQAGRWRRKLARAGAIRRIAYICHPAFVRYVAAIRPERVVYHAYDLFDHQPGWNDTLDAAERSLLKSADLVLAPSEALADELARKCGRPVQVLLNAADVPRFLGAARVRVAPPADLAGIPAPRIGYLGSLHPQLDWGLIRRLAAARPAHHWVLIGPRQRERDLAANPDFVALSELPNVHFLGSKDRDAIPDYTVNMDVNVMVYRSSEDSWTRVAYPLKLHEYLASGRPIVSMELPMLRRLDHVIRFAHDTGDWLAALDDAVEHGGVGDPAKRQAASATHNWDARARELNEYLCALMESTVAPTSATTLPSLSG